VSILLVDDHPLTRNGLKALLSLEPDLEVVGEAEDGRSGLAMAKDLKPRLVLLDVQMPKLDGFSALRALREQVPDTAVLMLTSLDDEKYLFQAIEAGASGYVLKKAAEEEVLGAIRTVLAGGAFVRPPVEALLAADTVKRVESGDIPESYEKLTPREKEILALVARGMTNHQIADQLVISARTVETHRAHVMDKLGFHSRAELVNYALRLGYLT